MKLKFVPTLFLLIITTQTAAMDKRSLFLSCYSVSEAESLLREGIEIPDMVLFNPYHLSVDLLEFYLRNGARIEANEQGNTPLHNICNMYSNSDDIRKADLLVKRGINLCTQDQSDGNTALHCAARFGASMAADAAVIHAASFLSSQFRSLCSTIVEGCRENHARYKEYFTLRLCLLRLRHPLYGQKDLLKARFTPVPHSRISPYQLLSIKNNSGKTPHNIWGIDILDPSKRDHGLKAVAFA